MTLAGTSGTAILTDAQGVILDTTFTQSRSHEQLMPVTTRIGVNLAEEVVGTTAPGITARTGQPSVVLGSEHFFGSVQTMCCAAEIEYRLLCAQSTEHLVVRMQIAPALLDTPMAALPAMPMMPQQ